MLRGCGVPVSLGEVGAKPTNDFTLSGYRVLGYLGQSNFVTLLAEKEDRRYVLKIPSKAYVDILMSGKVQGFTVDPDELEKLRKEVKMLRELDHPHIIRFHGYLLDPIPALVLEYCPYGNISRLAEAPEWRVKEKKLEILLKITIMVLDVLDYVHQKKIIHGDIKPTNILLGHGYVPKIADFGTAKLSDIITKTPVHYTPGFGAHEQLAGKIYPATDVLGAAATFYYLWSGKHPYPLKCYNQEKPFKTHRLENPGLPRPVWEPLKAALHWDWRRRPTAWQLAEELAKAFYELYSEQT